MAGGLGESLQRMQEATGGEVRDGVVGKFESVPEYSETLSAAAGEVVNVIYDYCVIRVPGNANADQRQIVRKRFPDGREVLCGESYTRRFPRAWDAFLRGEDLRPAGTLLEECPAIPRARLPGLKAANIVTVEELIQLPDASLRRVGHDARALQHAAAVWLEDKHKPADMAAELSALKAELAAMKAAKPRGRPRKAEVNQADGDDQDTAAECGEFDRSSAA